MLNLIMCILLGSFDDQVGAVQMERKKIDKDTETKLTSFRQILLDTGAFFFYVL